MDPERPSTLPKRLLDDLLAHFEAQRAVLNLAKHALLEIKTAPIGPVSDLRWKTLGAITETLAAQDYAAVARLILAAPEPVTVVEIDTGEQAQPLRLVKESE